jgi:hypothetical protein
MYEDITEEQLILIFKGIRPEGISKRVFDILRKDKEYQVRQHKKGYLFHNSINGPYVKKN